jgi:hypothetical protein
MPPDHGLLQLQQGEGSVHFSIGTSKISGIVWKLDRGTEGIVARVQKMGRKIKCTTVS